MRKRLFLCLLAGMLLLSACAGGPETEEPTVTVYRILPEAEQGGGDVIGPVEVVCGGDEITAVTHALNSRSAENRNGSYPYGVYISEWEQREGELILFFCEAYKTTAGMDRAIVNACTVLSFCALSGIECVTICVGREVLEERLTTADIMLHSTEAIPYETMLQLFYVDTSGHYLTSEYHMPVVYGESPVERYVIAELLRGAGVSGECAVPAGTRLLSISTENGLCTVNLSSEFHTNCPSTALGARLAIYSIVNSLVVLPDVDRVQILVEGKKIGRYLYFSLSEPLAGSEIGVLTSSMQNTDRQVLLYAPLPGTRLITGVPAVVSMEGRSSLAEAVVRALFRDFDDSLYPDVFPDEEIEFYIRMTTKDCELDLPALFYNYYESPEELQTAIDILVATLTEIEGIDSVLMRCDGKAACFEGLNLGGKLVRNEAIIVE